MKLYKLTDENGQTYNETQWGEGISHETNGKGPLCGPGWLHAYENKYLAVILNPIHADFKNPQLWEAAGEGKTLDDRGLKFGVTKLTTIKKIRLPKITPTQKIAFGILCALEIYKEPTFVTWAENWLSGADRSTIAAYRVAVAANAAHAAAYAYRVAAAYAASATTAATTAATAAAAYAAAYAAHAAHAAHCAAYATASDHASRLDFVSIWKKASKIK